MTSVAVTPWARSRLAQRLGADSLLDLLFVPTVLGALIVYLGITADGFLSTENLRSILLQGAILAIVAFGMTYLILAAELDLSVGSGVALVSVVTALVLRDVGSLPLGILAGIGTGVALGLFNGLVVTRLEVPSFIATLGTLVIAHGIALALTNGAVIGPLPDGIGTLADDGFLGVRWLVWLVAAVFLVLVLLQTRTAFGAKVMAIGGNDEAARLSGIKTARVRLVCFVIVGVCVGLAGIGLTARVESGQPNAGTALALTAIAAVVVGGTSITGGRGSVYRTLWGVLLLSVLDNGLDVQGLNPDTKQIVIGAVFVAAASVDVLRARVRRIQAERSVAEKLLEQPPDAASLAAQPPTGRTT